MGSADDNERIGRGGRWGSDSGACSDTRKQRDQKVRSNGVLCRVHVAAHVVEAMPNLFSNCLQGVLNYWHRKGKRIQDTGEGVLIKCSPHLQ